ncbi:MAG: hypothetical protein IKF68_02270 [Erysipelotrichaceae bacterium]|nr:hypothetical protein [Erysipelotrichaceae bacterium]
MIITKATEKDLEAILSIVEDARRFLRDHGVNQWQDGYPNRASFLEDIAEKRLYVVKTADTVSAVFALVDHEETYDVIYDGEWLNDRDYVAVHRIAVKEDLKGTGIARFIFDELKKKYGDIRVDTHEGNINMRRCLLNNGFRYCGIIYLKRNSESDTKRLAYHYSDEY